MLANKLLAGAGNEVPPGNLPFSKLGAPPEKCAWWRPLGMLYLSAMTLLSVVLLVAGFPAILVLTAVRRWVFRRPVYHTKPNERRIAVIGGGWSGLQCMARLKELGVEVTGFERYDAVGGTWHSKLRYHSVQIHGAMWITSFANYPYSTDTDENDGKISGEEAQDYCKRFMRDKGLEHNYQLNSTVVGVKYNSASRTAMLVAEDSQGRRREEGPFDLVVWASLASEPNLPSIPGAAAFQGKALHSTQFKQEQFDEIVRSKAKVAVVGGSKAGCDLALCFQRSGYPFNWVYRTPYLFWKYEVMFHDRSFINALRGFTTVLGVLWSLVSRTLAGWIFWSNGVAVTHGAAHNDWTKFHFGILCPEQRRDLAAIPTAQRVVGSPARFVPGGLEMKDGRTVEADYVLFATGSQSGMDKLALEKDGVPYALSPTTRLLNYFIVPDFPVFASCTSLFTTFGPVRAVNSADLAVYHLCVRAKMTEEAMRRRAARQIGGSTSSVFGLELRKWLCMHVDLMLAGLVDYFDFLWHSLQMFCFSEQDALRFRILPGVEHVKSR